VNDLGSDPQPEADEPPGVAALDDTIHARRAKAYHLHFVQHQTITYTAEALGCSRSTAWRLARQGQQQAAFLRSSDEQVKQALADAAGWLVGALAAERDAVGGRALDYAPVILKALKFEADIRGALAIKAAIISGQVGVAPDPDTVAALQALFETKGP